MITALRKALVRLPTSVVAYDIETSGLIPEYDQVLQVAALRTDQQFSVPVDETSTLELRARRQPWVVPSPTAMVVTRIDPDMLSIGLFHHELIAQTQKFFLETPSLFLTDNGIKFDERFMRTAFFRSLCRPYVTQTNGAMRADLMIIAQAISVLDPSAITVPISDKGRPTFRLGMMCRTCDANSDEWLGS